MLIQVRPKKTRTNAVYPLQFSNNATQEQILPQTEETIIEQNEEVKKKTQKLQYQQNSIIETQFETLVVESKKQKNSVYVQLETKTLKKVKRYILTPQIVFEEIKNKPQDIPFCRICLEQDQINNLLSPCNCDGSVEHVHQECLKTWLLSKFNIDSLLYSQVKYVQQQVQCELCHQSFQFKITFKKQKQYSRLKSISKLQKLFLLIFPLLIIILIILNTIFILQLKYRDKNFNAYVFGIVVCFLAFFLIIYFFVTMIQEIITIQIVDTWTIHNKEKQRIETDASFKQYKTRGRSLSQPQIFRDKYIEEQHYDGTIFKFVQRQVIE